MDPQKMFERNAKVWASREKSCLSNWYPLVKDLVPTPKTEIIKTNCHLSDFFDGTEPEGFGKFRADMADAVEQMGFPCFIRTGQTSAKHSWKDTCFLQRLDDLENHILKIVEFSEMADLVGLDSSVWVVREMLPTEPLFYHFNHMPITKERRYFIDGGKVVCRHPYWPMEAFYNQGLTPLEGDQLAVSNFESDEEICGLTALSEKVGQVLTDAWSVDWLWTKNGWYLTDMAAAEGSYHWKGCPNEF